MRISVFRKAHFNAAHRLYNPQWTDQKNKEVFGPCSNPHYHGHNYELEVRLTGKVNPETGYLYDLGKLKNIIKTEIEDRFDHKNLNLDCEEFSNLNPTLEYICFVIYGLLRKAIDPDIELKVKVWETPRNYAEFPA
ncbi:MAG TPA: 6-carboxytetrahydropterin synthase [Saprospiraceae bacterium]|nr:6-carboxytetrahydropterin synthase [Saprospiraceae bacterium]